MTGLKFSFRPSGESPYMAIPTRTMSYRAAAFERVAAVFEIWRIGFTPFACSSATRASKFFNCS